jgi:hypothetical protein
MGRHGARHEVVRTNATIIKPVLVVAVLALSGRMIGLC